LYPVNLSREVVILVGGSTFFVWHRGVGPLEVNDVVPLVDNPEFDFYKIVTDIFDRSQIFYSPPGVSDPSLT
jgi:hypothetical protein